jgi:hypothetical protein
MNILMVVLLGVLSTAQACRGVESQIQTYLPTLPKEAEAQPIVARVRVLRQWDEPYHRRAEVAVVEPIKGVTQGQRLTVRSETHSCAGDREIDLTRLYYIAGEVDADGLFSGVWHGHIPER